MQNRYSSDTKIDAAGAQLIADMLAVNRSLTALDVRGNALGDGSTALAEVVSKNQQIVTFCEVPVKQMRDDALDGRHGRRRHPHAPHERRRARGRARAWPRPREA